MIPSTMLPGTATWLDMVRMLLAIALMVTTLLWLASRLLEPTDRANRHRLLAGLGLAVVATLLVGWLTVSHIPLLEVVALDGVAYQRLADALRADLPAIRRPPVLADRSLFLILVAITQAVFGAHAYVTVVLHAVFAGTSYLLLIATVQRLVTDPAARARVTELTALVYVVHPAIHVWMGSPLREALMLVLLLACVHAAVRVATGDSWLWLVASVGAALLLLEVRTIYVPVALVAPVTAALGRLLRDERRRRRILAPPVLLGGSAAALLVAVWQAPSLSRVARQGLTGARSHRNDLGDGGTALPPLEVDVGWGQAIAELPSAVVRYLVGPVDPGMLTARPQFLVEVPLWLLLVPPLLVGLHTLLIQTSARRPAAWVLVSVAAATVLLGALTLGNYGIISRIRLTTWLPLLPVVAVGLETLRCRVAARSQRRASVEEEPHDPVGPPRP